MGSGPENECRRVGTAARTPVLDIGCEWSAARIDRVNAGKEAFRVPMWLGEVHVTN